MIIWKNQLTQNNEVFTKRYPQGSNGYCEV